MSPLPRAASTAALLALAAAGLAGCPLPQALPEFPTTGTIAPPRLRTDVTTPIDTEVTVDPACGTPPAFTLASSLVDENTIEPVEARWFVDYAVAGPRSVAQASQTIPGPENGLDVIRPVQAWTFHPYDYDPGVGATEQQAFRDGGGLHVVELVVSNGFEKDGVTVPRPNRTPARNFETQVFRWVFHYAPANQGGGCALP